jgi:hypothetical protein
MREIIRLEFSKIYIYIYIYIHYFLFELSRTTSRANPNLNSAHLATEPDWLEQN